MQFDAIEIPSWNDFKTYISTLDRPVQTNYLFRGHGSQDWELSSTFDRRFKDAPDARRNEIETSLVTHFQGECVYYPQYHDRVQDKPMECRALAQHNGLPTRLLDWTESPYIAAYFAFQDHLSHEGDRWKKVAIWMLNRRVGHFWSSEAAVELIPRTLIQNERMLRQRGWFTMARAPYRSVEQYVMSRPGWQKADALRKLVIPASEAEHALLDLDLMGINARALLADLGGAARCAYIRTVIAWMHRTEADGA